MKQTMMWAAVALMTVSMVTSCSESNDVDEPMVEIPEQETPDEPLSNEDNDWRPISLTRSELQMVAGSNDFAFNLFRQVRHEVNSQILSPISITYALGMLNNGAAGETRQQMNQVLGFADAGADGINAFCQKMLTEAPALDKLTKVMISNTIFTNKGYELKPVFLEAARTCYNAEPETRDFHDGKTLDAINQWASDHTEQMIEQVLSEDSFNPDAVSYLLNAIYFKGAWAEKFNPAETEEEVFEHAGDSKELTTHPMMHQEHPFQYGEDDLCQTLSLPYGNGAYTMTILLPREGKDIGDVLSTLTAESWQQRCRQMESAIVDVKLPRFESNTDIELNDVMSALGMPKAFSRFAEFPDFCDLPTCIGMMKQVARIKLSEAGTEAAAVTVVGMVENAAGTVEEPRRVEFHANRPFLYVITEQSTGAIFFIGQFTGY